VVMKNCFQIPVGWKIDKELVKDLVRATNRTGLVSLEFFKALSAFFFYLMNNSLGAFHQ
jgi:hypothetical protein